MLAADIDLNVYAATAVINIDTRRNGIVTIEMSTNGLAILGDEIRSLFTAGAIT